jgi:hypothetical protein
MAFDDGGGFGEVGNGVSWGFCGLGEELVVELLARWRGSHSQEEAREEDVISYS